MSEERRCAVYSECSKELVEADESAAVGVQLIEQLVGLRARHAHSEVLQSVRQFFAVQSPTAIVVDHAKRSAPTTRRLLLHYNEPI